MDGGLMFLFLVFLGIIGFFMFLYFVPVGLWITAIFAGVRVTIGELIGMRIRKVPPGVIVNSLITA
ncbi:MAG: flotillin-like FloA family protein, partial [Bacteroidota bacterium]